MNLPQPLSFQWDKGNEDKNWKKHRVSREEVEQVFFDQRKQDYPDPKHSQTEVRKLLVGKTKTGRVLLVVYTLREDKVRVISARDLNKAKEGELYEKAA
jgi:uncharacterized DUF497 family protein